MLGHSPAPVVPQQSQPQSLNADEFYWLCTRDAGARPARYYLQLARLARSRAVWSTKSSESSARACESPPSALQTQRGEEGRGARKLTRQPQRIVKIIATPLHRNLGIDSSLLPSSDFEEQIRRGFRDSVRSSVRNFRIEWTTHSDANSGQGLFVYAFWRFIFCLQTECASCCSHVLIPLLNVPSNSPYAMLLMGEWRPRPAQR